MIYINVCVCVYALSPLTAVTHAHTHTLDQPPRRAAVEVALIIMIMNLGLCLPSIVTC